MSLFEKIIKNIKKWAFAAPNKISQIQISKEKNVIDALNLLEEPYKSKSINLINQASSILGERQLDFLYDQIIGTVDTYLDLDGYDWNDFLKKISMAIMAMQSQQVQEESVLTQEESDKNIGENIINIVFNYIKNNTTINDSGQITGIKPSMEMPTKEVIDNISYFNKIVGEKAISDSVASQIILTMGNMIKGDLQQGSIKQEYLNKQNKYKDLPIFTRGTGDKRGRQPKGDRVDVIVGATPQAEILFNSENLMSDLLRSLGGNKASDDANSALHDSIIRFLGPFEEIYALGDEYRRVDYKDGRILFFLENPDYLLKFVQNNGLDIDNEIREKFHETISSQSGDLPVISSNSHSVYLYLLKNYGEKLSNEIGNLIQVGDERVVSWILGKSRRALSSIIQGRQNQTNVMMNTDEGRTYEVKTKGKASEYAADTDEQAEVAKTYFYSVFEGMKPLIEKVGKYYSDKKDFVGKDLLESMLSAALDGVQTLLSPANKNFSKNLKVIKNNPQNAFKMFAKNINIYKILSKKGEERLQLKEQAEKMLQQGKTIAEVAMELNVDSSYIESTIQKSDEQLREMYNGPDEKEVFKAMREEGKKWIDMINYISSHRELDPNPSMNPNLDYHEKEVAQKIKIIKDAFGIRKGSSSIINMESKDIFNNLAGASNLQQSRKKLQEIEQTYLDKNNQSFFKDYYSKIQRRYEANSFARLGVDFIHWVGDLVNMAAEEAKKGDELATLRRQIFLNMIPIHSRFRSLSNRPADAWAQKYVPLYWSAMGEEGKSEKSVNADSKEYMIFAVAMRAINKIDSLSRVIRGLVKLSNCHSDMSISDEIDRIAINAKLEIDKLI